MLKRLGTWMIKRVVETKQTHFEVSKVTIKKNILKQGAEGAQMRVCVRCG